MRHPWITREFEAPIPLSYNDYLTNSFNHRELVDVVRLMVYLSHLPAASHAIRDQVPKPVHDEPIADGWKPKLLLPLTIQIPTPRNRHPSHRKLFLTAKGSATPRAGTQVPTPPEWSSARSYPEKSLLSVPSPKLKPSSLTPSHSVWSATKAAAGSTFTDMDSAMDEPDSAHSDSFGRTMHAVASSKNIQSGHRAPAVVKLSKFAPVIKENSMQKKNLMFYRTARMSFKDLSRLAEADSQLTKKSAEEREEITARRKLQPIEKKAQFFLRAPVVVMNHRKIFQ